MLERLHLGLELLLLLNEPSKRGLFGRRQHRLDLLLSEHELLRLLFAVVQVQLRHDFRLKLTQLRLYLFQLFHLFGYFYSNATTVTVNTICCCCCSTTRYECRGNGIRCRRCCCCCRLICDYCRRLYHTLY